MLLMPSNKHLSSLMMNNNELELGLSKAIITKQSTKKKVLNKVNAKWKNYKGAIPLEDSSRL